MNYFQQFKFWLCIKFPKLTRYILSDIEAEKLSIIEFRSLAALFNLDTTNMSDQEIKEGASKAAAEMSKAGFSAGEAGEFMSRISLLCKIAEPLET